MHEAMTHPVPEPDADDARWWEALQDGQLTLASCQRCAARWCRGLPRCPYCGAAEITQIVACGDGRVYSWVTVRRALDPSFVDDVPYTVVVVDLDEGARINGRLLSGGPVQPGSRVRFQPYEAAGWQLVGFTLLDGGTR